MQKESEIYYQHLIDERGDSALYKGITYIDNERIEHIYDHRTDDGISAIIKTLNHNDLYYDGIFQGMGSRKAPSFWMIIKAFIKFRLSMPYNISSFKKGPSTFTQTTEAEDFLDTAETQTVYKLCKKQRVFLNAHIIFCAKEVLKYYMQDTTKPMIFMLPINLREEITQNDSRGNDVSFIDIKVDASDSAYDIHRQIISKLKNRMQWGAWLATKMISFIPKFLHKFALNDYVKNTHRTGLISSVGKWNVEKRNENVKVNAIPVNFSHMPFSLSIIDWASALSLGLSLNKELALDEKDANKILNKIKNKLLDKEEV